MWLCMIFCLCVLCAQNIQYFYITNSMRTLVLYSNTGSVDRGPAYLYPTQYVPIHEKVYPIGTVFKLLACDTTVASRAVLYAYDVTETPPLSPSREASLLKTMIAERKVALGSCWCVRAHPACHRHAHVRVSAVTLAVQCPLTMQDSCFAVVFSPRTQPRFRVILLVYIALYLCAHRTLYCSWYANRQNLNAAYVCSGAKAGHNPIVRVENSTCVLTNRAYYQVRYAVGNDPAAFSSNLCWSVTPTAGLVVLDECMDSPDASQTFYYNGTTRIWSVFAGQDCLYVDTADNSTLKHGDPATVNCTPLSPVSFSPTVYGLQYNIVGVGGTFQFYSVYGEDVPVYDPVVAAAAEAAMTVAERAERAANEAHARQRMLRDHVAADRFTAPALLPHRLMY